MTYHCQLIMEQLSRLFRATVKLFTDIIDKKPAAARCIQKHLHSWLWHAPDLRKRRLLFIIDERGDILSTWWAV